MGNTIREVDDAPKSALAEICHAAAPHPGLGPNQKVHDASSSLAGRQSCRFFCMLRLSTEAVLRRFKQ